MTYQVYRLTHTVFGALLAATLLYSAESGTRADHERSEQQQAIGEARELYFKGVDGNKEATRESTKLFEQLVSRDPGDSLLLAYLGSNSLLESSRTIAIWRKNRLAKDGILKLDEAVSAAPENLEVRFIRAMSTFHLPSFFKREQQCEEDFALLAARVPEAVASQIMERRLGAAALYYHGLIRERKGDRRAAAEAWRMAASIAPRSPAGSDAARKLKGD